MILSFINFCKIPREVLKIEGFAAVFNTSLANVNEQKIIFDPSIEFIIFTAKLIIFFYLTRLKQHLGVKRLVKRPNSIIRHFLLKFNVGFNFSLSFSHNVR